MRIQLDGLQWTAIAAQAAASDSSETANETAPGGEGADTPATDTANSDNPDVATGVSPRMRISIRGRVEPFNGNYRVAFDELRTFMETLRTDQRVYSVIARKQPLDVNPKSTLTGEFSPATRNDQATFTVDLLVRFSNDRA